MNGQITARLAAGITAVCVVGGLTIYAITGDTGPLGTWPVQVIVATVDVDPSPECRTKPDGGQRRRYWQRRFNVRVIDDGGWLTDWDKTDAGYTLTDAGWIPTPDAGPGRECYTIFDPLLVFFDDGGAWSDDGLCSCRSWDAGVCNVDRYNADGTPALLPDGGQRRIIAAMGVALKSNLHPAGPGCRPMPCGGMSGADPWQDEDCGRQAGTR